MSDQVLLSVENLSLTVKKSGIKVVDNVSFSIKPGEKVALLGESGAGKSTLFKAVLRTLKDSDWIYEGSIKALGHEVVGLTPYELEPIRGPLVRCIFQEPALSLNPSLKIERQMAEAISVIYPEMSKEQVDERIRQSLIDSGLDPKVIENKYPSDISGGQRQRVGVAMCLCAPAPLLLADEPSNSLDSVTVTELVKTLLAYLESGKTQSLFIVTHDLAVLEALDCERVIFMHDGKIYEAGSIKDVFKKPCHPKLAEIVSLMNVLDDMEAHLHDQDKVEDIHPLFNLKDVQFGYAIRSFFSRSKKATLFDVNLKVGQNEFIALVGNSGSGKSTIGKLLTREILDFDGTVEFQGKPILQYGQGEQKKHFHREVQIIFQEPADTFDPSLTMGENLEECFSAMGLTPTEIDEAIDRLLDHMMLNKRMLGELPRNLSGGQKQRFALVRAFGGTPSMILADEPFNNLDLVSQQRLIELLLERKRSKTKPLSCVLISHDIGVVSKLCDRVLVIDQGKIVDQGSVREIVANPRHDATKRLIHAAEMLGSIQR